MARGPSGRKLYNNGKVNHFFSEGEEIPEGWVLGMVPRSEDVKVKANKKRKETNLRIYGTEAPLQSEGVKEKMRQTCVARYGVENPSQVQAVQEKRTQTFIERFGSDNPMGSEDVKAKVRATNLERYGVENPFASEEVKQKIRESNLERLGVEYPTQSEEVRDKVKQTCLEKYGVANPLQSEEVQEKRRATSIERYGTEYPMQSQVVQDKAKETLFSHYGVTQPMHSEVVKARMRETNEKRYGASCTLQSEEVKQKISQTCQEKYGVPWACMRPEARAYSNDSGPNREFATLLDFQGFEYDREFRLDKYSFDFRVGNTLIEINPFATHNSFWDPFGGNGVESTYHFEKSKVAEENGYRCVHVFDWDSQELIVGLLHSRETVYARKCSIKEVGLDDCGKFLMENHLQGSCRGQDIRLGLYYQGELVSLMTFGKPRYNRGYQYELLRYCSIKNVIGGASRLFRHFIRENNPDSVISYCDRSKFLGNVYKNLGMILKTSGTPSCHWYSCKSKRHITDNLLRQRGADQLIGTSYGKGVSNEDIMLSEGYVPIYDCGQDVYTWKKGE